MGHSKESNLQRHFSTEVELKSLKNRWYMRQGVGNIMFQPNAMNDGELCDKQSMRRRRPKSV